MHVQRQAHPPGSRLYEGALHAATAQLRRNLETFTHVFPADTTTENVYPPRARNDGWTTGFWTGMLWLAFELTHEERFRHAAVVQVEDFQARLRDHLDTDHHDLGFLLHPLVRRRPQAHRRRSGQGDGPKGSRPAAGALPVGCGRHPGVGQPGRP